MASSMNRALGRTSGSLKPCNWHENTILCCQLIRKRAATCRCSSAQNASSSSAAPTAEEVVAIIEGAEPSRSSDKNAVQMHKERNDAAAVGSRDSKEPLYKALLAIILKLSQPKQQQQQQQLDPQQQQQQQLEAFLRSQAVATSIPFISWLADLEAAATGAQKAQLAALCEALLLFREQQDREAQQQLYSDTLRLLSGGDGNVSALMSAQPRQYALALAEGLTGEAITIKGFSPAYDALLQVAPPAALTPEGVAQGHALAAELAADLTSRRRSTLAAMLGRTRVTPEQQAQLMGGNPAARICNLLLTISSSEERLALLPDCFTPPDEEAAADSSSSGAAAAAAVVDGEQEMEELWCTPMQLLNEIEARLKAAAAGEDDKHSSSSRAAISSSSSNSSVASQQQQQQLPSAAAAAAQSGTADAEATLTGSAALAALEELRQHIRSSWLESLPRRKV